MLPARVFLLNDGLVASAINKPMNVRSAAKTLLVLALALPVVQCVLMWVRGLLRSMGDPDGAAIIGHIVTACMAIWSVSLVGLLILVAAVVLLERGQEGDAEGE